MKVKQENALLAQKASEVEELKITVDDLKSQVTEMKLEINK